MTVTLPERPATLSHGIGAYQPGDYCLPSQDDANPVVESAEYAIKVIPF